MLYVSVHIPKTAGTSFARSLEQGFTPDELHTDYHHARDLEKLGRAGVPAVETHRAWLSASLFQLTWRYRRDLARLPKSTRVVHGHFPARKYHRLLTWRKPYYIIWVRDPFARAVSNFFYWQTSNLETETDPLVRTVLTERWDLETFLFHPALQDYQSLFLRGVPRTRIDFLGVTEFFEEDLKRLSQKIGRDLRPHKENIGPAQDALQSLGHLRSQFAAFHRVDCELYSYALQRRREDMARDTAIF